jgi:D-alanyl-D-alanine carboxypeptidase (penicillin-binding protein 5/6)
MSPTANPSGHWSPERRYGNRRVVVWFMALLVSVVVAVSGIALASDSTGPHGRTGSARPRTDPASHLGPGSVRWWPTSGQAAIGIEPRAHVADMSTGSDQPVPIASLAKIMTALLVLRDHPLHHGAGGLSLQVGRTLVDDTALRQREGQSVVPVRDGTSLTEREALEAVLLPSANNIAVAIAQRDAGSVDRFVDRMNAAAAALGMHHTHYTDPSGFDPLTISTASDQLRLTRAALAVPDFAQLVRTRTAWIPVAGTITNTDTLLGRDGFVGVKTGSDNAAGGCFAFAQIHRSRAGDVLVIGVVLGQRGGSLIKAALTAARQLADARDASLAR